MLECRGQSKRSQWLRRCRSIVTPLLQWPAMATHPEARARLTIDALLNAAGWAVQDFKAANLHASRGVALREFPLNAGFGFADYLLYVDGKACGVIEAKKEGATLT